jgi:hypothetical protein
MVELYLHSPMSSWHSAQLIRHRDNFTIFNIILKFRNCTVRLLFELRVEFYILL